MAIHLDREGEYLFWERLYSLHLYPTKGEALLKAFLITISWIGGILCANPRTANAFYLFSLAIIMEYIVKLAVERDIFPKILPIILAGSNAVVFFFMTAYFFSNSESSPPISLWISISFWITVLSIILIWLDTLLMILIEHPGQSHYPESRLKDVRVKG